MTNEELKKKICDIIAPYVSAYGDDERIADALIATGIGDVKEVEAEANRYEMLYKLQNRDMALAERRAHDVEHRAARAERALRNAAPRLKCRGGLGKGFCRVDKCDYYHCNNDDGCVKSHLEQAEKELAEEKKSD